MDRGGVPEEEAGQVKTGTDDMEGDNACGVRMVELLRCVPSGGTHSVASARRATGGGRPPPRTQHGLSRTGSWDLTQGTKGEFSARVHDDESRSNSLTAETVLHCNMLITPAQQLTRVSSSAV